MLVHSNQRNNNINNNNNNPRTPSTAYRQEVVLQNQPQHVSSDAPEHTFWLNRNLERALTSVADTHAGRILYSTGQTVFVEEQLGEAVILPTHIANNLPVYTEQECRDIVRQMCDSLQLLHEQKVVHRTLHLNHIAVSPEVSN